MSRIGTLEIIAGTTLRSTLVSSGATMSPACSNLLSGSGTLVDSSAAVSSGNGFYYAIHQLPNTPCWYVNKWFAFISPNTYVAAQYVKAIVPGVN